MEGTTKINGVTQIADGGPAFPSDYIPGTATTPGMSLRQYYAGQALAGLISHYGNESHEAAAEQSFKLADAMIAAGGAK